MKNLYLGRLTDGEYELGTNRAGFDPAFGWGHPGYLLGLCTPDVHKHTNLSKGDLKPGTVRKVKITLELV